MITQLRGTLLEKQPPSLVLEVAACWGYELQASMQTFYQLPAIGSELCLYTHFLVREDGQSLYGFLQREERCLFRTLLRVNGVGPKVALAILSSADTTQLIQIFTTQNVSALQRIPGIGKKTAERLMLEIADYLKQLQRAGLETTVATPASTAQLVGDAAQQDAVSALIALGYKAQAACQVINAVQQPHLSAEQLIRLALQSIHVKK